MKLTRGNIEAFWFRLRELCFAAGDDLAELHAIQVRATRRLFGVGERDYGDAWKDRDNCLEGLDEWADGVNYALMEALRIELLDIPADVACEVRAELLGAARHGALAYGHTRTAQALLARVLKEQA